MGNRVMAQKVVLRRTYLTGELFLEEFAMLDDGHTVDTNGALPQGHYCIYYRAGVDCREYGTQYVEDMSGTVPQKLEAKRSSHRVDIKSIIEFFTQK